MDVITNYFRELLEAIPKELILAVLLVVVLTELTKIGLTYLENYLETKKGKQIKFFDHTKIIFVIFWSLVFSCILVFASVYTWAKMPLYFFFILGFSIFFYELILKKLKALRGKDGENT